MTIRNKTAISLTLMGLFVMASPSNAATPQESGLENEVNQCVAEVRSRMNWEGASHVKHVVVAIERRTVGHKLKISTAVLRATATTVIAVRRLFRKIFRQAMVSGFIPILRQTWPPAIFLQKGRPAMSLFRLL